MADEVREMLDSRERELKSLEGYKTNNTDVRRLINNRMYELKKEIESYKDIIRSRT